MNEQDAILKFSERLRELRRSRGLSMDSFCESFNARYNAKLNKSTVSRYENRTQEPMISLVHKIAKYFDVSPNYLLGVSDNKNESMNDYLDKELDNLNLSPSNLMAAEIAAEVFSLDEDTISLIKTIMTLFPDERAIVKATAEAFVAKRN